MGSSPRLRGGLVSRNAATISSTLLPSTPKAANSLALTFTTRDFGAMAMLFLEIDQEAKRKPPETSGRFTFRGDSLRNLWFRASSGYPLRAPWRLLPGCRAQDDS